MRTHLRELEAELESTKEELRKKIEQSERMGGGGRGVGGGGERGVVAEAESGDLWSRMGSGSTVLCYAPVAAMSYWRRWMGRPDDVHNS